MHVKYVKNKFGKLENNIYAYISSFVWKFVKGASDNDYLMVLFVLFD